MKIKTKALSYDKVLRLKKPKHMRPLRPFFILPLVIKVISIFDLWSAKFKFTGNVPKNLGPCLVLMNHSSFIDLKIAYRILWPKPFGIVCTSDGFIGKNLLMRLLGCIPTKKFVSDITLISDMKHLLHNKKVSVLMYPEASYSFDGTETKLPRKMGILLKKLGVPVLMIKTEGAFTRDPLYNGLQIRKKVPVSANISLLFSKENLKDLTVPEIDKALDEAFSFDNFLWQKENGITVDEPFRADGLHRILYHCPNCNAEGKTKGSGIHLVCENCKKKYALLEDGSMKALSGETRFSHIPDWYAYQREKVKEEVENGNYLLDAEVEIGVMVDFKAIYKIGSGRLTHTKDGFTLKSDDGSLYYTQSSNRSYSLYADYFWYEIGDVICIGDNDMLYYCFPKGDTPVAKVRLATEEIYKICKKRKAKI